MNNFRFDAILIVIALTSIGVAYFASNRFESSGSTSGQSGGDVEIPEIRSELELPMVALPPPFFSFDRRGRESEADVNRPSFADPLETALVEVRSALLASTVPTEVVRSE